MSICTFFGHRLCPATLEAELRSVLRDLIEYHGVDAFYIGNQGAFDGMALAVLRELAHLYPQITYTVVLAYGKSCTVLIRRRRSNPDLRSR